MPLSVTPLPSCSVVGPAPAWRMLIGLVCVDGTVTVFEAALSILRYVLPSLSTVCRVYEVVAEYVLIVGVKLASKPLVRLDVVAYVLAAVAAVKYPLTM